MEKIIIKGGRRLKGEVNISSAKNTVLPIIAASMLCPETLILSNIPMLEDVEVLCEILEKLNVKVDKQSNGRLKIDASALSYKDVDAKLIKKMRASSLIMGPLLAKFGYCRLPLPGGCNIGTRPIDIHIKGFKLLGASVDMKQGYVEIKASKLKGQKIYFDFPSVGATENLLMAAVFAEGQTTIENAAQEPEIWDLANFLNEMGADIKGAGTKKITINGVKKLKGGLDYTPIYDRIEAGTFMAAAAITHSRIKINGVNAEHMSAIIEKFKESGVVFEDYKNHSVIVDGTGAKKPLEIKTFPFPGFPTDMQSQMMAYLCTVDGVSVINETIFENRFNHVGELQRMGANIKTDLRVAIIEGVKKLTGCEVKATDLRAGAAMIIAGLVAEGTTTITDIYHIDRGYIDIEKKFSALGADIVRVNN